jgi:hypothetical protein
LNLKWLEWVSDRVITQHSEEDHMSVIGPYRSLPSNEQPGCGCAAPKTTGSKVAATALATALAAVPCTACCVLPFVLPATLLAFAGGSIAVLDHAHGWVTLPAVAAVIGAWLLIGWQRRKTGRTITRTTMALMTAATLLTATAAPWPLIQPLVFKTMGIVKKKGVSQTG